MNNRYTFLLLLAIALSLVTSGCSAVAASTVRPNVVISSPPSNSQFHEGEQVAIQSTSTDLAGVARVELLIDDVVVRTDPSPEKQVSFTVIQPWTATVGLHTVQVRAVNSMSGVSDPASISLLVFSNLSKTPAPTTAPAVAGTRPCFSSAFVSDVTVADGTVLATGQTFNKIWRVRNTGTCAWGANDQLVFVGGEAMTPNPAITVPATPAGATADLLVPMAAPATTGNHIGHWRLMDLTGGFFGTTLDVALAVVPPPAASCLVTPSIESFTVSPSSIAPGQSATLSWGYVKDAQIAEIDNDIGGVGTPGSMTINPATTTTYTLTAICGSKAVNSQVTINVGSPAAPPTAAPTSAPTTAPTPAPTVAPTKAPSPTPTP